MKYLLGRDFAFPEYLPRFPRPFKFDVIKMEAELEVDLDVGEVSGVVRYRVKAREDLRSIDLDAAEMEIVGASHGHRYDGQGLSIYVDMARGQEAEVWARYRAKPRKGMYFVRRRNRAPMAWTQGESEDNHYWIPIPDSPNIKFPWTITVVTKKPYIAVSNGVLTARRDLGDREAFTWDLRHPMSPYLLAVAIGDFERLEESCEGVALEYYLPRGRGDGAKYSFHNTCEIMKFLSQYLGMPYPYERYAQVVVEEFIYGGMENTTMTTLTDWTLHDKHAHCPYSEFPCPDLEDFSSDPLVAHEMVHQWFGDLVTAKDWAHISINESFATFLEALWTERSLGRDEYLYEIYSNFKLYLNEYNNRYARPIVTNLYALPEEVFDRHAYEKGSVVLHMLRTLLGDEAFRRGLGLFLNRYKYKNADLEDLRKAFEEASGRDLEWFWRQFFYSAGHPALKVSYRGEQARLVIEQAQPEDSFPLYTLPLELEVVYEDGKRVAQRLDLNEKRVDISLERGPKYFCVDPEYKLLKALELNIPLEMAGAMLEDEHVYCRIQAVDALKRNGSRRAVELLAKALRDGFRGVAAEAARALGNIGTLDAVRALMEAYHNVKNPRTRRAIVEALGAARRREAAEFLDRVIHDPAESYYVRAEAARSLGKIKWEFAEFSLKKALDYQSHVDIIKRGAIEGLAELGTDEALDIVLRYVDEKNPTWIRMTAVQALSKFGPRRQVLEAVRSALRDENFRVRAAAVAAALDLLDPRLLPDLQARVEGDIDGRIRRMAREAAEKIKRAMERGAEYQRLREEVERLRDEHKRLLDRLSRLEK